MLQDADVLKLKCNFVDEVLNFLTKRKYVVNPCLDETLTAYSKYALSTIMIDCLTYEDNCELQKDTACLNAVQNECPETVIPCADQISLTISAQSNSCTTNYSFKNSVDDTATWRLAVLNNSIYHPGGAQIVASNTCNNNKSYYNITTGCFYDVNTTNYDCNEEFRTQAQIYWTLNAAGTTSGYIKTIKLAHVDYSQGIITPVTVEYDIDPTNPASMTMWNSCPTCVAVNEAELVLNHPNFHIHFKNLLENISRTLWDGDVNIKVDSSGDGTSWMNFKCWIKHNPSGPWMGYNKSDFSLTWAPQGAGTKVQKLTFTPNVDIGVTDYYTAGFFKIDHQTPCELDTFYASYSGINASLNKPACNFHQFVVNSPNMTMQSQTNLSQFVTTCYSWTLTASSIGGNVTNYEWYDYNTNTLLGTGPVITVSEHGIYQVRAYTANGCLRYSTITV